MIQLLTQLTARLLLVAAVAVTVLVQYQKITLGGWDVVATSSPFGWIVFSGPLGNTRIFQVRPYTNEGEVMDMLFDKEQVGDDLSWYDVYSRAPSDFTLAVYHWIVWLPLLLVNVALWWLNRRCRCQNSTATI